MPNPLILLSEKPVGFLAGRAARHHERWQRDQRVIKAGLTTLQKIIPEFFTEPPQVTATVFDKKWPKVHQTLQAELTESAAYRLCYNYIAKAIEQGNEQGIWDLVSPPPFIVLKRQRPLRTERWNQTAHAVLPLAQAWLKDLQQNDPSTLSANTLFIQLLLSAIFLGGLNRPVLWCALAQELKKPRPLHGAQQQIWLLLQPTDSSQFATNQYDENGDAETVVRFFPDTITLGLIRRFLKIRPAVWHIDLDDNALLVAIQQQLKPLGLPPASFRALARGGIAFTESLPGIALPEVLLEYAIGRQPGTSLPEIYWRQIVAQNLKESTCTHYADFAPLKRLAAQSGGRRSLSSSRPRISLLASLQTILHPKQLSKARVREQFAQLTAESWELSEDLFFQWIHHLLFAAGNEISTARRYISAIGHEWLLATTQQPLNAFAGEDFFELYQTILNRPQSHKNREYNADRLEQLHQFCVQYHQFPPLPQGLTETSQSAAGNRHVCAGYVSEPLFFALLTQINEMTDLSAAEQRTLQTFLIIAYRCGLRPGEIAKLQIRDLEPSEIGWLFVRENRFGHNKTDAALRKVPLFPLLTAHEKAIVDKHLQTRRLTHPPVTSLFLCAEQDAYQPLDTTQLALMAQAVLKELSGGDYYRLYHLRHTALSRLQVIMHHELLAKNTQTDWLSILTPYPAEACRTLKNLIGGINRPRDIYYAIAAFAGHSSPAITLCTYLHFTDLILSESLRPIDIPFNKQHGIRIFGLSRYSAHKVIPDVYPDYRSLQSLLFKRLKPWMTTIKASGHTTISPVKVKESTDYQYIASQQTLSMIEKGVDPAETAAFYQVTPQQLTRWEQTAIALRDLKTKENKPRLFPRSRQQQFLPAEPHSKIEKQEIAKLRAQCRQLRQQKEITGAELREQIKYLLLNVNSSRAGIRFDDPERFKIFMRLMLLLFSVRRWRLELQLPSDQEKKIQEMWFIRQRLKTEIMPLRKVNQYPNGLAVLYLSAPEAKKMVSTAAKEPPVKNSELAQKSTSTLRYLFHRLAILLFTAGEIRHWQTDPDPS